MLGRATLLAALALCFCRGRNSGEQPQQADEPTPQVSQSAANTGEASSVTGVHTPTCSATEAANRVPVGEASGATWLPGPKPVILVVGDSGNRGRYAELEPNTGETVGRGRLPLDGGASDDLEGVSYLAGEVVGLTSSGWLRHWKRTDSGYQQVKPAYPLVGDAKSGLRCRSPHETNCAANYEGLCLRFDEVGPAECAGFAASKRDGRLYCLISGEEGRLAIDPSRTIEVGSPGTVSGCHFDPDGGDLWVGANILAANSVYVVRDWATPSATDRERVGSLGAGLCEAIAVAPGGRVFRMSDLGGTPSLLSAYQCD